MERYKVILRTPGALAFSTVGWLARLPMATVGLGLVLLVSDVTGSYGLAGSVAAAYVLGVAAVSPFQGRLIDQAGQPRVLPWLTIGYTLLLAAVITTVQSEASIWIPHVLAAGAGGLSPQIGSFVRARWSHLLAGRPELQTAFALEAMLDEVVFMLGPPLVTLLATAVDPVLGLAVAIASGLIGSLLLAAQRRTAPPAYGRRGGSGDGGRLRWRVLGPVVAASVGLGVLFGAVEIVVVALATDVGARSMSGVLLGIWAFGSMLAALAIGMLRLKGSPVVRFRLGAAAMAVTMMPLPFIGNLGVLGVFMFLAGFAISPTMISSIAVIEHTTPAARLTEGIAWATSALVGGVALGAAVVGQVIDQFGPSAGFLVPVAGGALAALAALAAPASMAARPDSGVNADATPSVTPGDDDMVGTTSEEPLLLPGGDGTRGR